MILSILIPGIPERIDRLTLLVNKINSQITENMNVEVLVLIDNMKMSIGEKREKLKNMAKGKYWCMVDDDDDVSDYYVGEIYAAALENDVDVICFDTIAKVDGMPSLISVNVENENEQYRYGITKRKPSHVNAWKSEKFNQFQFGDRNYGEDFDFCKQCYPHITSSCKIEKVLHYYTYDNKITRAS